MFLVGSDYIYPRESNRIMRDLVESYGGKIVDEVYVADGRVGATPARYRGAGEGRWRRTWCSRPWSDVGAGASTGSIAKPVSIRRRCPIASLTMAEGEIREIGAELCEGHITAATYFGSLRGRKQPALRGQTSIAPSAPTGRSACGVPAAYAQVHLFALALERAGTLDTQRLVEAALGLSFEAPEGAIQIDPDNNHTWLTPRIGRVRARRQFRCRLGERRLR